MSILKPNGSKTTSSSEALAAISEFWRPIWNRRINEEVLESVNRELSQPAEDGPQLENTFPSPKVLLRTARTTSHGAAGPDGWSGDEVVHWSLDMWKCYHELLNRWARRGVWPRSWQHIRQVHIRKKEDVYEGEAVPPKDMRPISVQSILVRIVGSAFASQKEVKNWVISKVPACCHGSLAARDVATAWSVLNEAIEHKKIIASLDYEKCFDHVLPKLALAILRRKGLSPVWCGMLSHIWEGQRRWLQLGRDTATTPAHISGSLPQGDALSPLALILLLADDAAAVANRDQVSMSMYVDDRAVCSTSASSVIQAVRAWNSASNRLGLKENEEKTSFVCFSAQQKHDLMAQGVSPHSIQSQARILGVDVMTNSNDVSQTMMGRCQKGLGILARLAFCPIGREVRRALYRSRVIPLLTWAVWMRSLPQDVVKETRRLYRCLSRGHPMGSAALRTILEGHRTDPQFWALQQSVEAAVRANKYRPLHWQISPSKLGWQNAITQGLHEYGWRNIGPWIFEHPAEGTCCIVQDQDATHKIRESWRRWNFQKILAQNRRDSRVLSNQVYHPLSCQLARTLYEGSGNHGRAVLVGAALSTAVYHRIRNEEVPNLCPWCNTEQAPDWDHLVWHCANFQHTRPARIPVSLLKRRLGWPDSQDSKSSAAQLLHHMSRVREQVMERFA